jgi:hypothetical protein
VTVWQALTPLVVKTNVVSNRWSIHERIDVTLTPALARLLGGIYEKNVRVFEQIDRNLFDPAFTPVILYPDS